jgi:hypothetical protein
MTWKLSDDPDFVASVESKREKMYEQFWSRCEDERDFSATGAAMIEEVAAFISFTLQKNKDELGPFMEMLRGRVRAFWNTNEGETLQ